MSGKSELIAIIDAQIAALQSIKDTVPSLTCFDNVDQFDSGMNIHRALFALVEANSDAEIKVVDQLRSFASQEELSKTERAVIRSNHIDDLNDTIFDTMEEMKKSAFGEAA